MHIDIFDTQCGYCYSFSLFFVFILYSRLCVWMSLTPVAAAVSAQFAAKSTTIELANKCLFMVAVYACITLYCVFLLLSLVLLYYNSFMHICI